MNTPDYPLRPISRGRRGRLGFTLIELLTVVAIIGVLAALLVPVVGRVRESAKSARCVSNLRQTGVAIQAYIGDNNGYLPPVGHLSISPYFNPDTRNFQHALSPYLSVVKSTSWSGGKSYAPTLDCPGYKGEVGNSCFSIRESVTMPDGETLIPWARLFDIGGGKIAMTRKPTKHSLVPPNAIAIIDRDLSATERNHSGHQNTLHFDWHVGRVKLPN